MYRTYEEKLEDARNYQREDRIPWPVLIDDLDGTVHKRYGMLADPAYLIDANGYVAFFNVWTHAPTLDRAITALMERGSRGGIVNGGMARMPHLGAALTDGWRGLRRGLPQSFTDLEMAAPGMASGPWLGQFARPVLAPLTLRAEPLPLPAKVALATTVGAFAAYLLYRRRARPSLAVQSSKSKVQRPKLKFEVRQR